jgi:soluble lytic murein transglycosylase-like protein
VRDTSPPQEPKTPEEKKSPLLNPEQKRLRDMIRNISQCMGIDPELTSCLAHQESKFDGRAKSSTGAIGCMQVLT